MHFRDLRKFSLKNPNPSLPLFDCERIAQAVNQLFHICKR